MALGDAFRSVRTSAPIPFALDPSNWDEAARQAAAFFDPIFSGPNPSQTTAASAFLPSRPALADSSDLWSVAPDRGATAPALLFASPDLLQIQDPSAQSISAAPQTAASQGIPIWISGGRWLASADLALPPGVIPFPQSKPTPPPLPLIPQPKPPAPAKPPANDADSIEQDVPASGRSVDGAGSLDPSSRAPAPEPSLPTARFPVPAPPPEMEWGGGWQMQTPPPAAFGPFANLASDDSDTSASNGIDPSLSLGAHAALGAASFIPGPVGALASFGDAALSLQEGDPVGAAISLTSALIGSVSDAGAVGAALSAAKRWFSATNGSSKFVRSFNSHRSLVRYLGAAGHDMEWHHIVEQSMIPTFGAHRIHSTANVVALPKDIHMEINRIYSTANPFADGKVLRDWLREHKSYEEQYEFGMEMIGRFLGYIK
jgi:hypothetical protein